MMELAKGAVGAQEIVKAGGVAAVVAAMSQHTEDAKLQDYGCCALCCALVQALSCGDAACKQAIVDDGGVTALVVAIERHAARKQAVVDPRSVAAVVAASCTYCILFSKGLYSNIL